MGVWYRYCSRFEIFDKRAGVERVGEEGVGGRERGGERRGGGVALRFVECLVEFC